MVKITKCIVCGSKEHKPCFQKQSGNGDFFNLVRCRNCGLRFLSEIPKQDDLEKYYKKQYFTKRSDRGYNDYFSSKLKSEIERVFKLNLNDLKFDEFETDLKGKKSVIDIGCAAGYFINYIKNRGWDAYGIDISKECVDYAKSSGLKVQHGNYLEVEYAQKFNLITLWATIEHLSEPGKVIDKIYQDLTENGKLYISTCRIGGLNFMKLFGSKWRFYNFPEHIYFFSRRTLKKLLNQNGFLITGYITYGSNIGKSGSVLRKIADFLAKRFYIGDMMLVSAGKRR